MVIEDRVSDTSPHAAANGPVPTWLRIALKWKKLLAFTAAGVVLLAWIAALLLPNRYTASVVLLPPQEDSASGLGLISQLSGMGAMMSAASGLGLKNPNEQQVALLKSRPVEDAIIERFHLQDLYRTKYLSSTRKRWEGATKTDSGLKDGLIRISVTDHDPKRSADLANGWVEEYKRFSATLAITAASQRRLFYEHEVGGAQQDLTRAEEEMKQTEQRTGVIDLEGQGRSMIASAAVLRGQLAAKQVEIKAMREFAAEGNPDLQRAQQEAAGMEAQLAQMDATSERATGDLVVPKGKATQTVLDYARAMRELKYRETVYELLLRQYEGARVDEAREGALIQVVETAVVPDRPNSLLEKVIVAAGIFFALPLGFLIAAAAELAETLRRARQRVGTWTGAIEEIAVTAVSNALQKRTQLQNDGIRQRSQGK